MRRLQFYILIILLMSAANILAQMGGGGGYIDPDSLETVTVTGTAIVDTTTMMHSIYYLDENNDGTPDYMLNFGPWWYEPDSSDAVRPQDGDEITIEGGLFESMMGYDMLIVYNINDEFWRDPFDSFWNFMGYYSHSGYGCGGSGFGWMYDSLGTVELSGTAIVDTTFMMGMYYLDTDNDTIPDYVLNFGPWWYEPSSGAVRPSDGDEVTIVGGKFEREYLPMVVVYEINGLEWMDSTVFCQNFSGNWIHRYMNDPVTVSTPFDHSDWMQLNPGWWHMGGPGGGGMMPDSLYCQIFETTYQQLPGIENENAFAAYEMDIYRPNGMNGTHQGGNCGFGMELNSDVNYQLHYNDIQAAGFNINESTIKVKYYDAQTLTWNTYSDAIADPQTNTITFSSPYVRNFIILTADQATGVTESSNSQPVEYSLEQNYPNPFNPTTSISFTLTKENHITLNLYNVLGQKIKTLEDGNFTAGKHSINLNAENLSSGTYFYELKVDGKHLVKKMNLVK